MSSPAGASPDDLARRAETLQRDLRLRHRRLREAAAAFAAGNLAETSRLLRAFLGQQPDDPGALYLLAETANCAGRSGEALDLLARCVSAAPDFMAARFAYAKALLSVERPDAALAEIQALLAQEPRNPLFREQKALVLEELEQHAASAALWAELVREYPDRPEWSLRYGHALRGIGRLDRSIAAYRRAVELKPAFGAAWWSLADLKTFRFSQADVAEMESQLAGTAPREADRARILFALGKAYEDNRSFEKSFSHYARANALHRLGLKHDPDELQKFVARCKQIFTPQFFAERAGWGCVARDPIFIVGMGRSGSTLVEQMLASHSSIEGTRELTELAAIARRLLSAFGGGERNGYPGVLEKLGREQAERLGGEFLARARIHRKLGRPHFTDKMGANFAQVGLIRLILPNARIIDVRRHPLACCFSNFAQLFPKGHEASYRLAEVGLAYRDYVELMAHFDRVLPGKIHRVVYEQLVAEPEAGIRRMLNYLELPFEDACLRFYETERVVTTISSQQVRNRIYSDAVERWRNFEPWLGPLKSALGPVLETYTDVPQDVGGRSEDQ